MMGPTGSKPSYACNPTDAAAHLLWCKQEARQLLKSLMSENKIPKDFNYQMARAKYHSLKGNPAKAEAIMLQALPAATGISSFKSSATSVSSDNDALSKSIDDALFKSISGRVTGLFLANMAKNPQCAEKSQMGLLLALTMNYTYADVRNWIEGFS